MSQYRVLGVENPLMDTFYSIRRREILSRGFEPGSMNLVPPGASLMDFSSLPMIKQVPGGSCANTLRTLAWVLGVLKQPAAIQFLGAVGADDLGLQYETSLRDAGIRPLLLRDETSPTGTSRILVDEEGERTMFTSLGASQAADPQGFWGYSWEKPGVLYSTGYMYDTPNQRDFLHQLFSKEKARGAFTAFDLADPWAVDRHREDYLSWIPGAVDLVLANEAEICALAQTQDLLLALKTCRDLAPYLVVKRGGQGSLFIFEGKVLKTPGFAVRVKDSTGAGDAFAGGFLAGILLGLPWELTSRLANALGAGIVAVEGCDLGALDSGLVWMALGRERSNFRSPSHPG